MAWRASFGLLFLACGACLPEHLMKYRKDQGAAHNSKDASQSSSAPGADLMPSTSTASNSATLAGRSKANEPGQRATIYALDKQTFRFLLREDEVWDTALNVLMRNYNLNIVDRQAGIVTTEWDSFYLRQAVYRNKITLRVRKSSSSVVDVTFVNNVERLRDASVAGSGVGAVWLPADDVANEMARLVQNMALQLNQAPPVLPPGMVAVRMDEESGSSAPVDKDSTKPY